ncbi:MAG: filamentous hemagglutinin N-terminal domain-containing protein [Gammaproteobacteria bacterium]
MNHFIQHAVASALALAAASGAMASPEGGTVVGGNASITRTPGNTTINQASQNAALEWQSFNIGVGEAVRFVQPNSSAVALNRVLGSDPSSILGTLSANGKVFLVNPNGVLFGKSAQVNVGGLVASTRDITVSDFFAGRYRFDGTSDGAILNQGSINANGGYVALLGARVSNEGVISARLGTVALAAGSAITLDVAGDGLLNVAVNAGSVDALVQNGGLIRANGGQVLLTAQSASGLMQSAVNNTGVIEAQTIESHHGAIRLMGDTHSGTVNVGGSLDASAPNGGDGGFVETSAAHVQVATNARITTSARDGEAGEWLIDPVDFTVAASGGDMTGSALSTALGTGNVVIQSTSGGAGTSGDVNVNDAVSWSSNQLTLNAQNNVNINATMNGSGTASLAFEYGQGAVAASNTSKVNVRAPVNLPTGNNLSMKLGSDGTVDVYSVINDMTAVQAMNSNLSGKFALGSNLDASGVTGFAPIGPRADYWDTGNDFAGIFDGLGHTISNLTIDRPGDSYVGLFNTIDGVATVRNIGLVNANVSGYGLVGPLAGWSYGTVSNTYATGGTATAHEYAGGLLGYQQGGVTENSYANVAVSTLDYMASTGGLVGRDEGGVILNTYALGTVNGDRAGGLVGECANCFITNSYAAGVVTNPYGGWAGGLIGAWYFSPVVTNSYWNVTTTGQLTSMGDAGTGLTTAQLQAALPTGFSSTVWGNGGNKTTPYLLSNPGLAMLSTDSSGAYYQIVLSLEQLQNMSSDLSRNYALGNDIDASVTSTWNSGAGFTPVGTGTPYTGNFDGLGHVIRNLYIDLPGSLFVGLFSDARGALRNIGVEDSNITGNAYVGPLAGNAGGLTTNAHASGTVVSVNNAGGLVGNNDGTIRYSYSSASASGGWSGGLAGNNNASGQIFDSYATGHVNGGSSGGLIGSNYGHATNVYATGYVTGNSNGGLVGSHGGPVVNGYWDTQTSNQSSSSGNDGSPRTTAQLQAGLPSGFSSSVWGNADNRTTPYLLGNPGPVLISADASGTYYNVVLTLDQLQAMNANPAGNYVLGGNVDAAASSGWNGGAGFMPVGSGSPFSGIFDGYGYTISNLTIDRPSADDVGLFGVMNAATVRNIGLSGASVTGRTHVGALAGNSTASSIDNAYSSGTVSGFSAVGGLIGALDGGTIRNAYSSASVTGTSDRVGGLAGQASNLATISTSYASGALNAPSATNVGGLVGEISGGALAVASFWNITANSGLDPTGGGVGAGDPTGATGLTAAELTAQASFTPQGSAANQWNFGSTWIVYEGHTSPLLRMFMTPLTVTANNAIKTYDGLAYSGNPGVAYSTAPNMSNLSGTPTFSAGTNVGNSALTVGGLFSNQQGYLISYVSGTLTVDPYAVGLTGTRAYDGTNAFSASQLVLGPLANGETLTLTGGATVASKDVAAASP